MKKYELYLELRDSKPQIWRRVQVNQNMTVAELCYIVLVLFEMHASHLFKVIVPKGQMLVEEYQKKMGNDFDEEAFYLEHPDIATIRYRYELLDVIDDEFISRCSNDIIHNVTKEKLKNAISVIGERMVLWYDFGDDWFVDIELTNIMETDEEMKTPMVLNGEGFGILEDCGGPWCLNEIVKVFQKKKGKQYKDMCDWLKTDDFDFSNFDINQMNERLKVIPQIYKRSYEEKKSPTQEEIDYIARQ